jgi:hypothetical protein
LFDKDFPLDEKQKKNKKIIPVESGLISTIGNAKIRRVEVVFFFSFLVENQ